MSYAEARPAPAVASRPWTKTRIFGHLLMTLWIVAGAYLLYYLSVSILSPFAAKYWLKYIDGFIVTLEIVVVSMAIGAMLSLPIAIARTSRFALLRWPAYAYVYFFRGTPLLAQTFLIYYGAGSFRPELTEMGVWWLFREAWYCIIFAFSLNTAAYQAEILRGSVLNVAQGQWEGGQALGLSRPVIFLKIILPQALMVALRPYGNELVLLLKGSAIASIVTVYDLMGETRRAFSRSYDFQAYIWAAVFYLIAVEAIRRVWERFEKRLTRHLQR
ncbi:ABC transporter permease [Roseibium algae]